MKNVMVVTAIVPLMMYTIHLIYLIYLEPIGTVMINTQYVNNLLLIHFEPLKSRQPLKNKGQIVGLNMSFVQRFPLQLYMQQESLALK